MAKIMHFDKQTYQCMPTSAHAQQQYTTMAIVDSDFVDDQEKTKRGNPCSMYMLCARQRRLAGMFGMLRS